MAINAVILDSGAVSALADADEAIRVALAKALTAGANVIVPTVVIAESTTGTRRDAAVNRVLKAPLSAACDVETARAAGALRYTVGEKAGVIDAIVVATADRTPGATILTADARDLKALACVRAVSHVVTVTAKHR